MMTLRDTQILISVQLVDDGYELMYLFAFVTGLFALLAGFLSYVNGWLDDICEAATFTVKVAMIAVKSAGFGLGVI